MKYPVAVVLLTAPLLSLSACYNDSGRTDKPQAQSDAFVGLTQQIAAAAPEDIEPAPLDHIEPTASEAEPVDL